MFRETVWLKVRQLAVVGVIETIVTPWTEVHVENSVVVKVDCILTVVVAAVVVVLVWLRLEPTRA